MIFAENAAAAAGAALQAAQEKAQRTRTILLGIAVVMAAAVLVKWAKR